jgi:hypothetical protein
LNCSLLASEVEGEGVYFLAELEVLLVFARSFKVFVQPVDLDVPVFVAGDEGILALI